MTDLQILRAALFDEVKRIKRGTAVSEETQALVSTSNTIINSFNTELKGAELLIKAQENGFDTKQVKIFNDSEEKVIDYKVKEDDNVQMQ